MAKNLNQIATAAVSILATDKMYIARSPFGVTDDRYILGSSIISQLASPLTTKGDLYTFSTVDARLAVGVTNGQILQVNSAAAVGLSWSTPTYPSASGSAGKILISDGTNNVYSTPTYPNTAGTTGSIIISDGTNKINSTSLWPNTVGTALHLLLSDGTSNVYSTPAYPNASVTAGKFIISDGTNYIASTSIMPNTVGSAGTIIRSDGTVNAYTTTTYPNTNAINTIMYASSANVLGVITPVNSAVMISSGTGVPSFSTTLPAGLTIPGYQTTITLPLSLANGGTNASLTANTGGIFYSTASAGAILGGTATAQQMLQSGATAAPSWSTSTWPATTTANQILYSSATNTVSEITAAANAVLITSGVSVPSLSQTLPSAVQANITVVGTIVTGVWTGTNIALNKGGTNASLTASTGGIVYSTASAMAILAGTATAGQMLQSGSTAAPTWSTAAWPATTTANQLLYSSTNNNVAGLTSANNGLLVTSSAGVPSILAGPGTSRNLLMSNAAAAPSFTTETYAVPGASGNVMTSDGTNWISAVPSSTALLTTKGDLFSFSTVDARLPVATGDGKILQVLASATTGLAYSTPTYPSASGGAGVLLRSDGTNNVYTTSTYPNTNAVSTLLYASSANVMAALATANSSVLITNSSGVPAWGTTLPSGLTYGAINATSINFGGSTLSVYATGSWTPIDGSGASLTFSTAIGSYTKIGNVVVASCEVIYPVTVSGANAVVGGLPFTTNSSLANQGGSVQYCTASTVVKISTSASSTVINLYNAAQAAILNSALSGGTILMQVIYIV